MDISYRQAHTAEFSDLAELLESFTAEKLSPAERQSGFVQGRFDEKIIRWFSESGFVLVALDDTKVVGALLASPLSQDRLPAPLVALKESLPKWQFEGNGIDPQQTLAYGPVCVSRDYQGRGILRGLYNELLASARSRYRQGVAFVATENTVSVGVHRQGLGMEILGEYSSGDQKLVALAFEITPAPAP